MSSTCSSGSPLVEHRLSAPNTLLHAATTTSITSAVSVVDGVQYGVRIVPIVIVSVIVVTGGRAASVAVSIVISVIVA